MDVHAFRILRAARRWRAAALVLATIVAAVCAIWAGELKRADLRKEVRWLEQRLAEKRVIVARQRRELAEVATAVDRVTRATGVVRDRVVQVRRIAKMEESYEVGYDATPFVAMLDGRRTIVSEDASRALAQLGWLEGQTAAVGDSLGVLNAVIQQRRTDRPLRVPTLWPVRGSITSRFGRRQSPWGSGIEMHGGIDIQARLGVPVTAGADGKVLFAGRDPGYGSLVIIDHGGDIDTYYGHLSALYVREGQSVRRGQPIGAVGATGRATGAHLHYEVRVRGTPVDPQRYLVN